jgi:hypothetical protein
MFIILVTPSHISNQNFPSKIISKEENDFYKLTYGSGKL